MWKWRLTLLIFILTLAGCGEPEQTAADIRSRTITMPGGQKIKAELLVRQLDILTGARYRSSIPPDRGLLFMFASPGPYKFWMYKVKIPVDMIWLDSNQIIVEMKESAPPCQTASEQCPMYGGTYPSQFVLEMGAGMITQYNLKLGQRLDF